MSGGQAPAAGRCGGRADRNRTAASRPAVFSDSGLDFRTWTTSLFDNSARALDTRPSDLYIAFSYSNFAQISKGEKDESPSFRRSWKHPPIRAYRLRRTVFARGRRAFENAYHAAGSNERAAGKNQTCACGNDGDHEGARTGPEPVQRTARRMDHGGSSEGRQE